MAPRRLVVCLDGTWNSAYKLGKRDDGHEVIKPSNVLKLARAVTPRDESGREQIVYYDIGVGSQARYPGFPNRLLALADKALGGARGAGFEGNVEDALSFLVHNHLPGDEVFVFGFSRGAATAQAVARFLDWAGGLPVKFDAYYLPHLFRAYVVTGGSRPGREVIAEINDRFRKRKPLEPMQPVRVEFLGLWDTVLALGRRRRFHASERPAGCVRHARQALAIDEVRYDFRPVVWSGPGAEQATLEQRWFAGVHSNVGGGYVDDGLANLAFQWILDEATRSGLGVDRSFASFYRGYPQDRLYRSESTFYRLLDAIRWKAGRGRRDLADHPPSANLRVDKSAIVRLCADPKASSDGKLRHPDLRTPYRPENLLRLLAAQEDVRAYLAEIGVERAELPDDVTRRLAKLRRKGSVIA